VKTPEHPPAPLLLSQHLATLQTLRMPAAPLRVSARAVPQQALTRAHRPPAHLAALVQ
jgi:hypothetical protein